MGMTVRLRIRQQISSIYAPNMLWCIFLFLFAVEVWLSAADIQISQGTMNIVSIASLTVIPIGIIALVEIIVFDSAVKDYDENGREYIVSQREQFAMSRLTFFILLALVPMLNIATTLYLDKTPMTTDALLQALVVIGALFGIALTSPRAQVILASVMIVIMCIFIVFEYQIFGLLPALLPQ